MVRPGLHGHRIGAGVGFELPLGLARLKGGVPRCPAVGLAARTLPAKLLTRARDEGKDK